MRRRPVTLSLQTMCANFTSPTLLPLEASVRLVSGSTSTNARAMQGRLEVRRANGMWSSVCDDGFTDVAATVVCRQVRAGSAACV